MPRRVVLCLFLAACVTPGGKITRAFLDGVERDDGIADDTGEQNVFHYSNESPFYAAGKAITPNTPVVSRTDVTSYTVSPALPMGLSLDATTGAITGTPAEANAAAIYTVTATLSTRSTLTATLALSVGALGYAYAQAQYTVGTTIVPNAALPSWTGATTYAIAPALPSGLSLDTDTGRISGTPTSVTSISAYVVSAVYKGETMTATIILEVVASMGGPSAALLSFVTTSTYDFNSHTVGTQTDAVLTISNSGGSTATAITEIGLAAPFSVIAGGGPLACTTSLAAGSTCELTVRFAPSAAAVANDTLVLSYNNGQSTVTASRDVTGTGTSALVAQLAFDTSGANPPNPDTFAATTTDTTHTYTLKNTGAAATSTITTSLTGTDAAEWTKSNDGCDGQTLSANATCTIDLTFLAASGAPGSFTAVLGATAASGGTATNTVNGTQSSGPNTPPTVSGDQTVYATMSTPQSFTLNSIADAETTPTYYAFVLPVSGVLTNCGSFSGSSGGNDDSCTYTPDTGFYGTDSFTYYAYDGTTLSTSTATVTFDVSPTIPAAPASLTAAPAPGQVTLDWSATPGGTTYTIYRGTSSGSYGFVTTVSVSDYIDTGLTDGITYYYVVTASNPAGESSYSNEASTTPVSVPDTPTSFTAAAGNGSVDLSWTRSNTATGYELRRGTQTGIYDTTIPLGDVDFYSDTGLSSSLTYYYVIVATNSAGTSAESFEVFATPTSAPSTPSNFAAWQWITHEYNGHIRLTWNVSASATGYTIRYATTLGGPYTDYSINDGNTVLDYFPCTANQLYYFRIRAENGVGSSADSSEIAWTCKPSVSGLTVVGGDNQATLSWNALAGVSSYVVNYTQTPGGPYEGGQTTTSLMYSPIINTVGTWYFTVYANFPDGSYAPMCDEVMAVVF